MMETIYKMFREQVTARPDAPAVMDEERTLTFAQLDRMVNTIASRFPDERQVFVGIVMDHSVEMIAAMLSVLKAGAAYVPAEPTFPIERIRYMMKEADVDFIITHEKYGERLNNGFKKLLVERGLTVTDAETPDCSTAEGLAYVLYTSGTTGNPKGVQVTNANVCHYVRAFRHEFSPKPGDRMLQHSVCSFDIFVEEVFATLLSGAMLCIPSEATKADMGRLMQFVEDNQVTMLSSFPYLLLEMNRWISERHQACLNGRVETEEGKASKLPEIPRSLRLLISGGDVIRAKYIDRLRTMGPMIYNTYGPSETTVCASYFRVDNAEPLPDGTFSIGKAVLGAEIEILDDDLKPVPQGETGEICIFGDGVSRGYVGNKPENENFTHTPDGRRVYRSGDLGYVLPDGNLAFLHRKDKQVMILGKRVESDEVENVLCTCSEVEQGVVCPYTDSLGLSYLVAYVVPRPKRFDLPALKRKMSRYLTPFMIPEYFVSMQSLPMTANGKVDRRALPVILKEGTLYE